MLYPKVASVAVFNTTYDFDNDYNYIIPNSMIHKASVGSRVLVPFGKNSKECQALVLKIHSAFDSNQKLKEINKILDETPILNNEMIKLLYWMKSRYFCTYHDAIKVMIPPGIQYNLLEKYILAKDFPLSEKENLSTDELKIIEFLSAQKHPVNKSKLLQKFSNIEAKTLAQLVDKNLIKPLSSTSQKIGNSILKMLKAEPNNSDISLPPKQKEIYDFLNCAGRISQKELIYYSGASASVINSLIKKNLITVYQEELYRIPYNDQNYSSAYDKIITLTPEQQKAFDNILKLYKASKAAVSLLYGVTGSGKTSVFIKLIDKISAEGKGIIFMLPEISLTTQMINLFKSRYGEKLAVFHSALSMGERLDEYKRVKKGIANIVLGTRSAIFSPLDKIGIIIIDEEQEFSYKSESTPRFNAKDIAKFRANEHNAILLLASATPSIETYYKANQKIYQLNVLNSRYGNAKLPKVSIVDMNEEIRSKNDATFLSNKLIDAIADRLNKKEQIILLLNRRGYNTFVKCRNCKEVITCPNCSISLTYHSSNKRLMCHYCGYSIPFISKCPNCNSESLIYTGVGTQRLEEDLKNFFPGARVLRMDADNILNKTSYSDNFRNFKDGKYDIMTGTQMVAKGLDFPMVTLVGVLNADHSMYSDDFRSYEKTFDLITQVVGRSGRHEKAGEAIIQTYSPENNIISMAAKQDYDLFYKSEIDIRKSMLYPPFSDIYVIIFSSKDKLKSLNTAKAFSQNLQKTISDNFENLPIKIFRISESNVIKLQSKYNYKLIIKTKNCSVFRNIIASLIKEFSKNKYHKSVYISVDVNPL